MTNCTFFTVDRKTMDLIDQIEHSRSCPVVPLSHSIASNDFDVDRVSVSPQNLDVVVYFKSNVSKSLATSRTKGRIQEWVSYAKKAMNNPDPVPA